MSEFVPRSVESRGKSIDEAIFRGLMEMGVSIDEVDIETLQEGTKGLLGIGSKPYIIRLTTKEVDLSAETEKKQRPRREKKPRTDRVAECTPDAGAETTAPKQPAEPKKSRSSLADDPEDSAAEQPRQRRDRQKPRRSEAEHFIPRDDTPYTPYVPGETECPGADFLLGVLKRMGVDCGIGFADTPEALKFKIDSDTMGVLIGHRGETLDSLQYLTGLIVNRNREEYRRVVLDTENYRNKREDTLVRLARKLAGQVRSTGKPMTLEPMNPYERRVLHATLQNNPYVTTHSTGEEPNRRVVIEPVDKSGKQ